MKQPPPQNCKFTAACEHQATVYPILCLPPPLPFPHSAASRSAMLTATCTECALVVTIENFMLPEARAAIAEGFQAAGRMIPDFDRAWLEWGTIGDDQWHEAMHALTPPQGVTRQ